MRFFRHHRLLLTICHVVTFTIALPFTVVGIVLCIPMFIVVDWLETLKHELAKEDDDVMQVLASDEIDETKHKDPYYCH